MVSESEEMFSLNTMRRVIARLMRENRINAVEWRELDSHIDTIEDYFQEVSIEALPQDVSAQETKGQRTTQETAEYGDPQWQKDLANALADVLDAECESRGMTRLHMAARAGISRQAVRSWRGAHPHLPSVATLCRLASVLGMSPSRLLATAEADIPEAEVADVAAETT